MREVRVVEDRETVAAVVGTSRDTAVAAADADKKIAAASRKRAVVAAVVCSRGPRH